jgi:hypothetical protein
MDVSRICGGVLAATVGWLGCSGNQPDEPGEVIAFHRSIHPQAVAAPAPEAVDLYLDYSDGMYPGIQAGMELFRDVLDMVRNPTTRYFRVGQLDAPVQIDIALPQHNPLNMANYVERRSVLDRPLAAMVEQTERTSVFVTDFELVKNPDVTTSVIQQGVRYETQIDLSSWAVEGFARWLGAGNQIDILAVEFGRESAWTHQRQSQRLYVLLFTPAARLTDDLALVNRLARRGYAGRKDRGCYHLRASVGSFPFHRAYESPAQGGLHPYLIADQVYIDSLAAMELYDIDPATYTELLQDPAHTDKKILRNLTVGAPDCFRSATFGLAVRDVTHAFAQFSGEPPGPDAANGPALPQMFRLERQTDSGELSVTADAGGGCPAPGTLALLEVEVVDAEFDDGAAVRQVLAWQDARGFEVPSLFSSLREAVERTRPRRRPVYSYYLRF